MSINFDSLPQDNPYALPAPGLYKAKIVEAEMRAAKSKNDDGSAKPDYLNLKLMLFDKSGKSHGAIYDIISESDKNAVKYKTGRFIRACSIPLTGSMELKDLAKIVRNKDIVVDVIHDKKSDPPRAQVSLFGNECYYTLAEFDEVYNAIYGQPAADGAINEGVTGDASETPFDAPDGNAPMNPPSSY
jgi:hypothetical protein